MKIVEKDNHRFFLIILALLLGLMLPAAPAWAQPWVSSPYYCLMDRSSGQILLSQQGEVVRPVASTTKMMTAVLALEYADLNEIAVVSEHADRTAEYTIGLRAGQKMRMADLMKAALICSANDAAVVIAEHVAGDEALFGHLMSLKAFILGASNTHFCNASGLPAVNHYSTAIDLAVIGRYALSLDHFKKLVGMAQAEIRHPGYQKPLTIRNTNGLLGNYPGADGIKTGTTNAAGKCLVASATREGRKLIAVALKSGNRQGDCARLLDYGFENYTLQKIINHQVAFKTLKIDNGAKPYVDIFPGSDLWAWVGEKHPHIEKIVNMDYSITAPVTKGQKVGELNVYSEGKLLKTIDLVIGENINEQPGWIKRMYQHIFDSAKGKLLLNTE
ncbi:MAG: D-alanyl-D-alanine carboxypeptidase family protein [Syntrophomonadaceae bacterium]|jgi:D-alanyl-D-alanine carboxypeptidase (penicillin-binding protein 5/6)